MNSISRYEGGTRSNGLWSSLAREMFDDSADERWSTVIEEFCGLKELQIVDRSLTKGSGVWLLEYIGSGT
jgi:hypothetical protein